MVWASNPVGSHKKHSPVIVYDMMQLLYGNYSHVGN